MVHKLVTGANRERAFCKVPLGNRQDLLEGEHFVWQDDEMAVIFSRQSFSTSGFWDRQAA
jgi:hypothetical protein